MSNFEIFDRSYIQETLNLFHIDSLFDFTPIRYEALTPDRFIWLFRAGFEDKEDQFFVVFQDDSIQKVDNVYQAVADWAHTAVTRFIEPRDELTSEEFDNFTDPSSIDEDVRRFTAKTGVYFTLLALVDKPQDESYWTNHIVLKPGDNIRSLISADVPEQTIKSIQDVLFRPWISDKEVVPPNMYLNLYYDPLTKEYHFFYSSGEDGRI